MKKEDVTSLIVYLFLIAAAIISTCSILTTAFDYYHENLAPQLFTILVIVGAILTSVIGLELFHMLGAKIGGYEVVRVNVLGFCFEKKEGTWQFKFSDFNGLTGETTINKKKDNASIKPYIWLPIIAYVVEFILMVVLYNIATSITTNSVSLGWLAPFSIIFLIVSTMIALYNIIPLKLDSMTDGYRMVLTSKPENIEAFNELMRIENLARNGEKINGIKTFETVNDFTANVNLYSVFEEVFNQKLDKAIKLCDEILEKEKVIDETTYFKTLAQKIYCLIDQGKIEEAKKIYEMKKGDAFRRYIANSGDIETLRSYAFIAAFVEESESEVNYVLSKKSKSLTSAFKTRAEEEKELLEKAYKKIYKAFPKWEKK